MSRGVPNLPSLRFCAGWVIPLPLTFASHSRRRPTVHDCHEPHIQFERKRNVPVEYSNYKSFVSTLENLSRRYDLPRVFDDFLTASMCSVHQINIASRLKEKDPENEKLYLKTIERYDKKELEEFGKLLGIFQTNVYNDPYSDLLGKFFTENITHGHNGQYFTPDAICEAKARLVGANDKTSGKHVYDPSCGSGRLCLQFAKIAPNNYFYANDVSSTCAKMTSLNFMFNGLRGEVACMNTLSMEWYTGWKVNIPTLGIRPIEKEESMIWTKQPEQPPSSQQLKLF